MIEAAPWPGFARWFNRQTTARLRRSFAAVHVQGLQDLQRAASRSSVLLVANHSAWWDGLVAIWLGNVHVPGSSTHGLFDAQNLSRLRFFQWLGGFGVDRTSRRDGARVTRYALSLLQRPGALVWVFPQGEEQPPHVPLHFEPGAAGIARRAPQTVVLPVAFAYVFEGDALPHLYISVGGPLSPERRHDPRGQAQAVDAERSRIQQAQLQHRAGFETLLAAPTSRGWGARCLDWLAGRLLPRQARALEAGPKRLESSVSAEL